MRSCKDEVDRGATTTLCEGEDMRARTVARQKDNKARMRTKTGWERGPGKARIKLEDEDVSTRMKKRCDANIRRGEATGNLEEAYLHRALSDVWMPALAMVTVCCSMTCVPALARITLQCPQLP